MNAKLSNRTKPVLRWQGSKSRLLKHILPLITPHVCYCEPFFGGGAVLFAKERSPVEVVNDINGNLVALYRNLQFHLPAVLTEINWLLSSRQNLHDFIAQPGITELQRATRFLLVNRTSFGGNNHSFGVCKTKGGGVNFKRDQVTRLFEQANKRLDGVVVENISYERIFKNYDSKDTFHFIDSPYEETTNGGYKGFTQDQLKTLRKEVGRLNGKWIVTLNDSPFTRSLFAGCAQIPLVTANRAVNQRTHSQQTFGELIITPQ